MLEVRCLAAGYGTLEVIQDVSLTAGGQEIVLLLGPNGAGKTTLFRVVAGQLRPRRGGVAFQGRDLTRMAAWEIARQASPVSPRGGSSSPASACAITWSWRRGTRDG